MFAKLYASWKGGSLARSNWKKRFET